MPKILTRAVPVLGVVLPAGTELTEEQEKLVTNPKAFVEAPDATGPDANDARRYQNHVQRLNEDAALRKQKDADDGAADTDDSAARGAKLARGGRAPAANG